jgi:hypothetical protein
MTHEEQLAEWKAKHFGKPQTVSAQSAAPIQDAAPVDVVDYARLTPDFTNVVSANGIIERDAPKASSATSAVMAWCDSVEACNAADARPLARYYAGN